MEITKISYTETVELPGLWKKIGVDATLSPKDDKDECFRQLQQTVKQWQGLQTQPRYEHVADNKSVPIKEVEKETLPEVSMIDQINSCTELKTLETYKLLIRNNSEWSEAYRKKLIELSPK